MTARRPGQHRDPLVASARPIEGRRPTPGPIAVLPEPTPAIREAVESAGGTLAALDSQTRAIIWLGGAAASLRSILDEHPGVEWVQLPLAGVESHAETFAAYADSPLLWTSAKGAYAEPVAEHALTLILGMMRQLPDKARSTTWQDPRQGQTLFGARVTIVGAGGIAAELIRLLAPFETTITVVRRGDAPVEGAERTVPADRLDEVLAESDVVVLAAPSTPETRGMIGAAQLAAMPDSAVLVNIARGDLVDQDALLTALAAGRLWGAGLDVTVPEPLPPSSPLWLHPRCIVTSHSADTDEQVEALLAERVRHNVAALLGPGDFVGVVDPRKGY